MPGLLVLYYIPKLAQTQSFSASGSFQMSQFFALGGKVMSDSLQPQNRSTPGLPVHHHLPEFTQTRIHRVGDAIQPSHPRLPPTPPAPNPSHHQSLFQ